jgi:hypothetical protein
MLDMEACLRFRLMSSVSCSEKRVGTRFLPIVVVLHCTILALVKLELLHRVETLDTGSMSSEQKRKSLLNHDTRFRCT